MEEQTLDLTLKELGILPEEYQQIVKILGREPNYTELSIYSVMWSEHASYKNSREMAVLCKKLAVEKGAKERHQTFCVGVFLIVAVGVVIMAKPTYEYLSRFDG